MKSIRIKNDLFIKWRVYRFGNEEDFTGKNVIVKLVDPNGNAAPITYTLEGNTANISFEGRNQSRLGKYSLLLCENPDEKGMVTLDKTNAFVLVAHSDSELLGCGCGNHSVEVEKIDLSSDIDLPANGKDGDSAYKIAVAHGFVGTEEEWIASLSVHGKSAYEIAVEHGFVGTEDEWLDSLKTSSGISIDTETGVLMFNGRKYQLAEIVEVLSEDYGDITASLVYPKVKADGGVAVPELEYSQTKTIKYSNGTTATEEITSGASLYFSGEYVNADGTAVIPSSNDTEEHVATTVNLMISMNGKVEKISADIMQEACAPNIYYSGDIKLTASNFAATDADTLVSSATRSIVGKQINSSRKATKSCFYLLVPESYDVTACSFVSGGLSTNIVADNLWNLQHDDITIEGVTYKVYGYRSGGISETDPITFNYSLRQK